MILVDTSVWVDHLRIGAPDLARLLDRNVVLMHPLILAEIALGTLKARAETLRLLASLPAAPMASVEEVLAMTEKRSLHGRGIGYVDVSLLASCLLAPGTRLWTRDRRLDAASRELDVRYRTN